MWKVVAADDEGYIREALQKLINWEKMDCSLESVVSDGQELLEKIRGEMPDIVITSLPHIQILSMPNVPLNTVYVSMCLRFPL